MTIHVGDCIEVMAGMEADSVDAVVTDPPYGLEFMGKEWDKFTPTRGKASLHPRGDTTNPIKSEFKQGVGTRVGMPQKNPRCRKCFRLKFDHPKGRCNCEMPDWDMRQSEYGYQFQYWCEAWGREALRVTRPGGYLLAFGGTRTHHRLVCGLEDAGWIIRDELDWIYASGFPKGRANLKPAHEPIVLARKPGPLRPLAIDECRIPSGNELIATHHGTGHGGPAAYISAGSEPYQPGDRRMEVTAGRWPSNVLLTDAELFDTANPGVVGSGAVTSSVVSDYDWGDSANDNPSRIAHNIKSGQHYGDSGGYSRFFIVPKSSRSDREPVLKDAAVLLHVQRGECDKLRAWASEDQSPDEPMVSTSPARAISEATTELDDSSSGTSSPGKQSTDQSPGATRSTTSTATSKTTDSPTSSSLTPLPTSASTPAANSATGSGGSPAESVDSSSLWGPPTGISAEKDGRSTDAAARATSGSSSSRNRCAVCGKRLPRVSTHPTQKPTDLMAHLIKLVTPTDGVVLDPFLGSGSTAIAAERLGIRWIGIEKEPEYVAIAEARLNGTQRGLGLDVPAPTTVRKTQGDQWSMTRDERERNQGRDWTGYAARHNSPPEEVA